MIITIICSVQNFINTIDVFLAIYVVSDRLRVKKSSFLVNFHITWMVRLCFNRCFFLIFQVFNVLFEVRLRKVKIRKSLRRRKFVIGGFLEPLIPEDLLLFFFSVLFYSWIYEWKFFLWEDYSNLVILGNINISPLSNFI